MPATGFASGGRYSVPVWMDAGSNGPWPPRSLARGSVAPAASWRLPVPVQAGGAAPGSAQPCASASAGAAGAGYSSTVSGASSRLAIRPPAPRVGAGQRAVAGAGHLDADELVGQEGAVPGRALHGQPELALRRGRAVADGLRAG